MGTRELRRLVPGLYVHARDKLSYAERVRLLCERYPSLVLCLETALWFRGIGPIEPKTIWAAIPRGGHVPKADGLGVKIVQLAGDVLRLGLTEHTMNGSVVPISQVVRAVAECFKYRKYVGIVTAVDAMHSALDRFDFHPDELIEWAKRLRVERLVRSHLAAWARRDEKRDQEEEDGPPQYTDAEPFPAKRRPGRPPTRRDFMPIFWEMAYRSGNLPERIARRAVLPGTKPYKQYWERLRALFDPGFDDTG